ncbi:MAG: tRNA pseudouridine(55) synthase TruB [Legionellales bacterium]|nr:tRNA pseudouridine(55) synthase TruB [Legionellales bacterium]|tara:strand:+ start:5030 stop:5953 length:924 start_codon:yes stop_codon:yes gene_type:complete
MRKSKQGRDISGILLLDKPLGVSSNKALQTVKYLYEANKAGHTGSLDPLASGMLPICLGEATKFSQYLLAEQKRYLTTAKLGVTTTTGDAEGEVVEICEVNLPSEKELHAIINNFKGPGQQVPSMFSALKHKGQPLYKFARRGIDVERKARDIIIHAIECLNIDGDCLYLDVTCSKGTYIRSLVEDIGKTLNCGAHVAELRRLAVGQFTSGMVTLEMLDERFAEKGFAGIDELLLDTGVATQGFMTYTVNSDDITRLGQGQRIPAKPDITPQWVSLYSEADEFVGLGEVSEAHELIPRKLMRRWARQ